MCIHLVVVSFSIEYKRGHILFFFLNNEKIVGIFSFFLIPFLPPRKNFKGTQKVISIILAKQSHSKSVSFVYEKQPQQPTPFLVKLWSHFKTIFTWYLCGMELIVQAFAKKLKVSFILTKAQPFVYKMLFQLNFDVIFMKPFQRTFSPDLCMGLLCPKLCRYS